MFWHLLLVLLSPLASLISGLLRDDRDRRDSKFTVYGDALLGEAGSKVIRLPVRSPNLNAYAERWVRTVREECLDRVIVLNEDHLRRVLRIYYHGWRTHLSLAMDCPEPREIQDAEAAEIIEVPEISGLHHHYERRSA
jgi:putative transposase